VLLEDRKILSLHNGERERARERRERAIGAKAAAEETDSINTWEGAKVFIAVMLIIINYPNNVVFLTREKQRGRGAIDRQKQQ
jgi:hypothetical protein